MESPQTTDMSKLDEGAITSWLLGFLFCFSNAKTHTCFKTLSTKPYNLASVVTNLYFSVQKPMLPPHHC